MYKTQHTPLHLSFLFFSGQPFNSRRLRNHSDPGCKTLFAKTPLQGSKYRVEPNVTTDGFLTRTTITSDFGTFETVGPGMLTIRLQEIEALEKLQTFESSDEFKKGAKESADEKWGSLKHLKIKDDSKDRAMRYGFI